MNLKQRKNRLKRLNAYKSMLYENRKRLIPLDSAELLAERLGISKEELLRKFNLNKELA